MHTANAKLMEDLSRRAEEQGAGAVEVMRPIQQLSLQIIGTAAFGCCLFSETPYCDPVAYSLVIGRKNCDLH